MNLDNDSQPPAKREFLAVVIAGFGDQLTPLTNNHGDAPCPKALMTVANKPILDYTLSWLEQSGITDVLLICPAIHRPAIHHHIHSNPSISSSVLRIDLQTFDETKAGAGTCNLLRHFSSRIQEDFILLPCDFIPPPSLPLSSLLNKFRADSTSEGALATSCWYAFKPEGTTRPEWGQPPLPAYTIRDDSSNVLLHVDYPVSAQVDTGEFELRMSLLTRHPRTKLSSRFRDSHVYVCRRSVLDVLHIKAHFHSFREDFIPWLCKIQYQNKKREKYGKILLPSTARSSQKSQLLALQHSTLHPHLPGVDADVLHDESREISASAPPSPTEPRLDTPTAFRIGLVLHQQENEIAMRVNNLHSLYDMNQWFVSKTTYTRPSDPKNRNLIDMKAQIASDVIVGESAQVSERTNIKRSVIGHHCVIGKGVKIVGCILLDHCVIDDGVKLEDCILGKNTKVGAKAELSRCVTQAGYEVPANSNAKGERFDLSEWADSGSEPSADHSEEESNEGDEYESEE